MKIKYITALTVSFTVFCPFGAVSENKKTTPTFYRTVDFVRMNRWVDSIYNQMSPDERIGQLFMPVVAGDNTGTNKKKMLSLVNERHIGGILFSKGTPADQAELTNLAQGEAKIPLMISLDGEWGLSMRLSNTARFPRNMMLGAIRNDSLLYYYGLEVARQCKLMGIHVNFAPVLDVNSNPANPVIGNRSFGEDAERTAKLGIMYAKGLEAGGVMAVAKHFPGHGDTSVDSHKAQPLITHGKARLENVELKPFREYIQNGLSGMMIAHLNIPALDKRMQPSSLSEAIVTGLLRDELGFSGLVFTDGLQMKGVSGEDNYCVRALQAGNDILVGPPDPAKDYESVKKAVEDKILGEDLIAAKCKKVLAYKYILGAKDAKPVNSNGLLQSLNTSYSEWINRELHKQAVTLLKDEQKIIPLEGLDKRKIAAVSIGESPDNTFHNTLKLYADVTCFSVSDGNELLKLKKKLEPFNTIIVSVHNNRGNADIAVQSVCQGKEIVMAFFIAPYRMSSCAASVKAAEGVILAYENSVLAQDYAAQAIFGGNETDGKIPVTVKGLFKEGSGINIKKTRLGYGMPETAGIASGRFNRIDTIVQEGIKARAYPGCQALIAKDGVVIYNRSFGSFEYNGNRKVTNDDIYDLASMTKAVATVPAIMKLYDESKIKPSDPVSVYVPALKGTDKSQITVRQALLHETGLPAFIPYYMDAIDRSSYEGKLFSGHKTALYSVLFDSSTWVRTDYKYKPDLVSTTEKPGFVPLADRLYVNKAYNDTIIAAIANSKLRKRKTYLYSCLNFMLLKEVVEKASGEGLDSFVRNNFFAKLGTVTSVYNPLKEFDKSRIVPTEKDDFLRKQLVQGYVHDEGAAFMGGISGNAGLFSNANDLAKLCQMWLNEGEYGGEEYLSDKTCRLFTKTKSASSRRGLGFDKPEMRTNKPSPVAASAPASVYGHTGFTGTCFWIDPDNDLIFIFLSNRINDKRTHRQLMSMGIRQRIQEEIYRAIKKGGALSEPTKSTNINTDIDTDDDQTEIE
ncbi:MAG: serine hydrolase [Prevotella sp.]|nr:serine hydrolase [Prevotella sp.]